MFTTLDGVRLGILLVLGLGAIGFKGWIVAGSIGGILALISSLIFGWPWAWSLQAGLAVVFALPLFVRVLRVNLRLLGFFLLIIGLPTFLASRYLMGSPLLWAMADGFCLMVLFPLALVRSLLVLRIIPEPKETISSPKPFEAEISKPIRSGAPSASASSPIGSEPRNYGGPFGHGGPPFFRR
jgi:hypothetical protein